MYDFEVYGGYPIRLKQIASKFRHTEHHADVYEPLMVIAEMFEEVLEEGKRLKEQLNAHEELSKLIADFGTCAGSLGAAQFVPTPTVDHMEHLRAEAPTLFGDREEWCPPREDKSTWPFPDEGKAVGHTQFMKLSERVQQLEKQLARIQGFSMGGLR